MHILLWLNNEYDHNQYECGVYTILIIIIPYSGSQWLLVTLQFEKYDDNTNCIVS